MQQDLPPHVRQAVEEAWATRLARQAVAWKSMRTERSATDTGIVVIRRPKRASGAPQGKSLG